MEWQHSNPCKTYKGKLNFIDIFASVCRMIRNVILSVFAIGVFFYGFYIWLNIPYVHKSYSEQKCLFIEYADGTTSDCSKLPRRYEVKWHK